MIDHYQSLSESANSFSAIARVKLVRAKMIELGKDPSERYTQSDFTPEESKYIIAQGRDVTWSNTTKYLRAARLGDAFLDLYEEVDYKAQKCKFIL
jgi:hypothetical protein